MEASPSPRLSTESLLPFSGTVGQLDYRPARVVPRSATIADASRYFATSDVEFLVVQDGRVPIGVIYKDDLMRRNMTRTPPQQESLATIMDTPVVTVQRDESVLDSLMFMIKHDVRLLVIMDGKEVMGVVTQQDWLRLQVQYPTAILHEISQAADIGAVAALRPKARAVIWNNFASKPDVLALATIVTVINDTITRKVISLSLDALARDGAGAPPAAFAWIGLGSAGRSAQTVATDQDNGLIYEDVSAGRADEVRRWFSRLAEHVVAGLETCGFPRCAGNAIATNPNLLGTLDHWKALFERIISKSADKDLFEASIYFDFRCQFGRAALADELRQALTASVTRHPYFLRHLVEVAIQGSAPPVRTLRWKLYQTTGMAPPPFDLKKQALMPLDACVRVLALRHGVTAVSTLDRIRACLEHGGISKTLADALHRAFDFLFRLRFKLEFSASEGADKDAMHMVDVAGLFPAQARYLNDALVAVAELREFAYRQITGRPIPWSFR